MVALSNYSCEYIHAFNLISREKFHYLSKLSPVTLFFSVLFCAQNACGRIWLTTIPTRLWHPANLSLPRTRYAY